MLLIHRCLRKIMFQQQFLKWRPESDEAVDGMLEDLMHKNPVCFLREMKTVPEYIIGYIRARIFAEKRYLDCPCSTAALV